MCIDEKESWMDPIKAYLKIQTILEDNKKANKGKKQQSLCYLKNDQLYKRNSSMLLLMCLNEDKGNYVLRELHERIYGSHVIRASLTLKTLRNGYFWFTMKTNAFELVKRCDQYQRHARVSRNPFL